MIAGVSKEDLAVATGSKSKRFRECFTESDLRVNSHVFVPNYGSSVGRCVEWRDCSGCTCKSFEGENYGAGCCRSVYHLLYI